MLPLVEQAAGIADGRVQRTHREGRVQHGLGAGVVLVLEQLAAHLVGNADIGALEVVIGREVLQVVAEEIEGTLVVPPLRQLVGCLDGEREVVGIDPHAPERVRKRVVGRAQRIAQAPVVAGVDGQDHIGHRLQSVHGTAGELFLQVGIGGLLVGVSERPHGKGVSCTVIGSLEGLEGRFGLSLLHQQRGIVHRHLVLGVCPQALTQHQDGKVHLVRLPVAGGKAAHRHALQIRVYAFPAHELQHRNGLAVGAFRHKVSSLHELDAAGGQVKVVVVGELRNALLEHLGRTVVPAHALIHLILHHIPFGTVSAHGTGLLDVEEGIVVIALHGGMRKQVLQGRIAVFGLVHTRVHGVRVVLFLLLGALGKDVVVHLLQFPGLALFPLGAGQGQGFGRFSIGQHEVGGLADEEHVARRGVDGEGQVVQRVSDASLLHQDVGVGNLVVSIRRGDAHDFLERVLGGGHVTGQAGLLISGFQHLEVVSGKGGVGGINL